MEAPKTILTTIFTQRSDVLHNLPMKLLVSLVGALMTFGYIVIEAPYGLSLFSPNELRKLASLFAFPTIIIWLLHLFVLQRLLFSRFSLAGAFVWLTWIGGLVSFYHYCFLELYLFESQFDWYFFPMVFFPSFYFNLAVAFALIIGYQIIRVIRK